MHKKMLCLISYSLILNCTSTPEDIPEIPKGTEESLTKIIFLETNTNEQEIENLKRYAEGYIKELINWFIITKEIIEKNHIAFANTMPTEDKQFMEYELENKMKDYSKNLFIRDDVYHGYTLDEKKSHFIPLMTEASILYGRAESIKNTYDNYIRQNKE
ncbi:hypothetical protein [Borrelia sp. P9F1]|uniref:hypothetical protein n=1 Tax=Borrelia sp. P9F1 TaxID=3058374 RepID=UPI002646FE78|nr:hypothetical protein [Borrelia sp. P9F1]WKC57975.1 hypothetical protein QYZ68_02120 [Borrelia sp. P9F1]